MQHFGVCLNVWMEIGKMLYPHLTSCGNSQTGHRSPLPWQRRKAIILSRNERLRMQTQGHADGQTEIRKHTCTDSLLAITVTHTGASWSLQKNSWAHHLAWWESMGGPNTEKIWVKWSYSSTRTHSDCDYTTSSHWKQCTSSVLPSLDLTNNNNNNNNNMVYGAVIMAEPLREFTRFIWWM